MKIALLSFCIKNLLMNLSDKFEFKLPDGTKAMLTIQQARGLGVKSINDKCDEIVADIRLKQAKKRAKDGFIPGWQANLGLHITCYAQYKRALKDRGLIEVGYDHEFKEYENKSHVLADSKLVESMVRDMKIDLSGQEIAAIESGEYFKD